MTIDEDSDLGKLEREARISRLWEKFKRDDEDRQIYPLEEERAEAEEYLNNLSSKGFGKNGC